MRPHRSAGPFHRLRHQRRDPDVALLDPVSPVFARLPQEPDFLRKRTPTHGADLNPARDTATHIVELVAAHGIVAAGEASTKHGASKVVGWLRWNLNETDHPNLAAVESNPASKPAQAALTLRPTEMMEAQPNLVAVRRDLVKRGNSRGQGNEPGRGQQQPRDPKPRQREHQHDHLGD